METFDNATRTAFEQYLHSHPNIRRVSPEERDVFVGWLAVDVTMRSSSQKESSRRNYVRKTFFCNETEKRIFVRPKLAGGSVREVITEDKIISIVDHVHRNHDHAGWDTTWEAIKSSYYGILRADVIFLLKRCHICALDPRKRPKTGQEPQTIVRPPLAWPHCSSDQPCDSDVL